MHIESHTAEDTKSYAEKLAQFLEPNDAIILTGDLGAGKTQFTQGLAKGLGIAAVPTSPTFNILVCYEDGRIPLFHFDLYRLEDPLELEDIDFYGVVEDGGVSVIEWGDKFEEELPEDHLRVHITTQLDGPRLWEVSASGPRSAELLANWEAAL